MDDPKVTSSLDFRERVRLSFDRATADLVLKAHDCAVERFGAEHAGHTLVADRLLRQHADPVVVTAALLAPLRRHGCMEASEVLSLFGQVPADLVEKVFLEHPLRTDTEAHREQDMQHFLKSISGDIRAVILRIGLRLAELERLAAQDSDKCQDIARETLELYVPLADRMGMGMLCTQLEDVCFRILRPAVCEELARNVEPIQAEDELCLELVKLAVERLLRQNGVNGTTHGRTKGLYSLYRKMYRLECPLEDIMDKIGLRIIVSSVEECYAVLGLLHTHFRPVPGTFDDYIGFPKENGYQSLHTCVYPATDVSHKPVEFQIRTEAMHRVAEYGIAAHWRYKSAEEAQASSDRQLQWLRGLMPQREKAASHAEFIEHLRRQVFDSDPVRCVSSSSIRPPIPSSAAMPISYSTTS
jgi:(p)ppGpp synthase/HD superfamily hydrolase